MTVVFLSWMAWQMRLGWLPQSWKLDCSACHQQTNPLLCRVCTANYRKVPSNTELYRKWTKKLAYKPCLKISPNLLCIKNKPFYILDLSIETELLMWHVKTWGGKSAVLLMVLQYQLYLQAAQLYVWITCVWCDLRPTEEPVICVCDVSGSCLMRAEQTVTRW